MLKCLQQQQHWRKNAVYKSLQYHIGLHVTHKSSVNWAVKCIHPLHKQALIAVINVKSNNARYCAYSSPTHAHTPYHYAQLFQGTFICYSSSYPQAQLLTTNQYYIRKRLFCHVKGSTMPVTHPMRFLHHVQNAYPTLAISRF